MPFTLAHGAAALPFRWRWVVPSALVVGTFAPDFEYFLRMAPRSGFGHSWPGVVLLTLPLGLAVLWVFHAWVKLPVVGLMPEGLRQRLGACSEPFQWLGVRRFPAILGSLFLGIATHVVWDWFTHRESWIYSRWAFLRSDVWLPVVGLVPHSKLLQHGSTVVGLGLLGAWVVDWYRGARVESRVPTIPSLRRRTMVFVVPGVAVVGAAIRVVLFGGGSLAGAINWVG
jgi:hypothetical protein